MRRRDFLHPQQLVRLVHAKERDQDETVLLRFRRSAMATEFEVILPFGTVAAKEAADAALDEIDRMEAQLSIYRPNSEVSRLNRYAFDAAVPVETNLFELLTRSQMLSAQTAGAFDITSGAMIKAWGFYRGPRRVPASEELDALLQHTGYRHLALNADRCHIRFLRRGLELNLGSIGKGYALDQAAAALRKRGIASALLQGGQSSILAIGTPPDDSRGWLVGIAHPWDAGRRIAAVRLKDRALATSAASFQYFEHAGRKLGHILDPRTGWPATGTLSASVTTDSAADADALATALFIQGAAWGTDFCRTHPRVEAILLPEDSDQPALLATRNE